MFRFIGTSTFAIAMGLGLLAPAMNTASASSAAGVSRWLAKYLRMPHIQFVLHETPGGRAALERLVPRSTNLDDGFEALIRNLERRPVREQRYAEELIERLDVIDRQYVSVIHGHRGIHEAHRLLRAISLEQLEGRIVRTPGWLRGEKIRFTPERTLSSRYSGLVERFLRGDQAAADWVGASIESQTAWLQNALHELQGYQTALPRLPRTFRFATTPILERLPVFLDTMIAARRAARWEFFLNPSPRNAELSAQVEEIRASAAKMYSEVYKHGHPELIRAFEQGHSWKLAEALGRDFGWTQRVIGQVR